MAVEKKVATEHDNSGASRCWNTGRWDRFNPSTLNPFGFQKTKQREFPDPNTRPGENPGWYRPLGGTKTIGTLVTLDVPERGMKYLK